MGVSVNDIIQIKAGKAESFVCDTPKQAKSGQSTVGYVKRFCADQMPADVIDYETSIKGNVLTILAVKG
jgi:hypothetical protein